jgi:uncharacterized protein (DUF58 family)
VRVNYPMWKSFLSSIGLLAIAMMAALYSSSAGRDGRVLAAAVSAFLALGIAIGVGIKFVPRLASHVDWEWLPFLSNYHVTREGWIYFATVTIVIFAAINTANNLLYMVLSALLAVLLLSGFLSALNFRFVRTVVRIPSHCYAGEPFAITIQAHNDKRVFPTLSISLEPADDSPFRFSGFYVPLIRGLDHSSQTGQALLPKRGHYTLRHVKASSRYPFGFFVKDRNYAAEAECICYPEIHPPEEIDLSTIDLRGSSERFERGLGHDLYMIRDYVPSDSARHVHWKASAKASMLKTREYAAEESRRITIAFDRFGHPSDIEKFERLVSYAASVAYHLIQDGIEVNFVSDEWHSESLESILEYLALVQMSGAVDKPPATDAVVRLSLR